MNLYLTLLKQEGFSDTEKEISQFIIENNKEVLQISIQELAAKTYISTATIIRFCKHLGFQGFKEFKMQYSIDYNAYALNASNVDFNSPFTGKENVHQLAINMATLTKQTIDLCLNILDHQVISEIVNKILIAENIFAVGISDSFIRIIDFQNKMLKINRFVKTSFLQPDMAYVCAGATPKDIALLVSYSGKSSEVINEAKILSQREVPIVAITSDRKSPLALYATYLVLLPNEENKLMANYSYASQIAIEYVLNIIYSSIYNADYKKNKEFLQNYRKKYLHPDK